jgi:hypothetical protein
MSISSFLQNVINEGFTFHFTGDINVNKEDDPAMCIMTVLCRVKTVSQCSQSYDSLEDSLKTNCLKQHVRNRKHEISASACLLNSLI